MPEPEFRLVRYRGLFAVAFYDRSGRHRISTGTAERGHAEAYLRKFKLNYEEAARPDRTTVEYAWTEYRKTLHGRPSHAAAGFEWKSVGPHFGHLFADDVTEADCLAYIEKRRKAHRKDRHGETIKRKDGSEWTASDGTIWTELGRLRAALRWAERKNLIAKAPAIKRPTPPPPRDLRMTMGQAQTFIQACEAPHARLFSILALTTGARMGALLDLTWDRVDFERGVILLANPERAANKKGRAWVPMNATARVALSEAQRGRLTPYVIEWGGQRVINIKTALRAAGRRCGLSWVTAHVFRHSAASIMAEAGVPMEEIAQVLGHRDSRTTSRIYARFSPTHLRAAAAALEIDFVGSLVAKRRTDRAR